MKREKHACETWAGHNHALPYRCGFSRNPVVEKRPPIDFEDILWLRRAATKAGADHVPPAIAEKLINAGLIEVTSKPPSLKITEKGRIALSKLG
jgi:hypothetical protein